MKICTLASGSSGNSLLVESGSTKVLVDAGLSLRQLTRRLGRLGVTLGELDAVLLTHEHHDHSRGVPSLPVPVYVSAATESLWCGQVPRLALFETGTPFEVGEITVTPFPVPHDAADPVGFTLEAGGVKLGVVTDIGSVTNVVRERLRGSQAIVVEFNHDEKLLSYGPYPWELKQRIQSRHGHLSNSQAASLVRDLLHDDLRHLVLAHLSKVNNAESIAVEAALKVLIDEGASFVDVTIAPKDRLGEVLEF